jgi:uncharacterized NAD(P)/FAD-binding protein YdhS
MHDVAIIGFGYSGNLVLFNLVNKAEKPIKILVADKSDNFAKGAAYATIRSEHLLNVRAKNMGALKDDVLHFYKWLVASGYSYDENDFVPRKIYGEYLSYIHSETLKIAKEKNIEIEIIKATASKIEQGDSHKINFDKGEVADCKQLVLATGNQIKDNPWRYDFESLVNDKSGKPVVIIGTGLTAVDTILSIFASGFVGQVICISRKGLFPLPHTAKGVDVKFDISPYVNSILNARPSQIVKILRKLIAENNADSWQSVLDSIRPYHQQIWKVFSQFDQKRILGKYFTLWNIHRHRMAPEIDAKIKSYIASGRLKIVQQNYDESEKLDAIKIFDCRGLSLKILDNIFNSITGIKTSTNGYGITCDENYIINSDKNTPIYALGSCFAGHLFETIAVPELRMQADKIAQNIVINIK